VGIACSYLFRSLGSTIGISASTAVLQQVLRMKLAAELHDEGQAREIEEGVRLSLDYICSLEPGVAEVVRRCYSFATQHAFAPIALFAVLAVVSSIFIKEKKLER
jgi:hypothetical protein